MSKPKNMTPEQDAIYKARVKIENAKARVKYRSNPENLKKDREYSRKYNASKEHKEKLKASRLIKNPQGRFKSRSGGIPDGYSMKQWESLNDYQRCKIRYGEDAIRKKKAELARKCRSARRVYYREKSRERDAKTREQSAADQFFILSAAAQELTETLTTTQP